MPGQSGPVGIELAAAAALKGLLLAVLAPVRQQLGRGDEPFGAVAAREACGVGVAVRRQRRGVGKHQLAHAAVMHVLVFLTASNGQRRRVEEIVRQLLLMMTRLILFVHQERRCERR